MKIRFMPENPTNADIISMFEEHSNADHAFQEETRKTDKGIEDTLQLILNKLDPEHRDYINKGIETDIKQIKEDQAPLLEIYEGFIFGRKALLWTSGAVGALALIFGSVIATIKFIK